MIPVMLLTLKGPASALLVAGLSCDPVLARLFTPRHPQIGRYEVCAQVLEVLPGLEQPRAATPSRGDAAD